VEEMATMRWFVGTVLILLGVVCATAVVGGVCKQGLAAVWPVEAYSLRAETFQEPSPQEAAVLFLAIGTSIVGAMMVFAANASSVQSTASEHWGETCMSGLALSLTLAAAALAFVILGPPRGATAEFTGAVFIAGAVQTLVALALVIGLLFLPRSKAEFTTLVVVWVLETGALAAMYTLGTGTEV